MLACLGGLGVVDLARASALPPVGCGSGESGAGPLDHGVAFELGEGGVFLLFRSTFRLGCTRLGSPGIFG
jgi:hypothetical protein